MQQYNRVIITDDAPLNRARWLVGGVFVAAMLAGIAAAVVFARQGLTLSHYDARAHLVVARRVVDSLTPGWRQIGAVWLPLPHLINVLPAQWDWNYRTGYLSTGISITTLAIGLAALAGLLFRFTASITAAVTAPMVILLNPNVLYLQSTPMTEPLLFGCSFLALAAVDRWRRCPGSRETIAAAAAIFALAWTRYEGWAIAGALVGWATLSRRSTGWPLAAAFLAAVTIFLTLGWAATGQWFVSSGFFVPDNPARHDIRAVAADVIDATRTLGGDPLVLTGSAGAVLAIISGLRGSGAPILLTLAAAVVLPIAAFYEGHPFRVRYMVPLVVACGPLASLVVAHFPRRLRPLAAAVLCAFIVYTRPPFDSTAPMVTEAQWETPYRLERQAISAYLDRRYDGTPILASMGSLAHYMQEASSHGLSVSNFVHEGNGDLWTDALLSPRRHVRWIAVEERAEGGDVLAARERDDPAFLAGFEPVAEGGGVVLFRRVD